MTRSSSLACMGVMVLLYIRSNRECFVSLFQFLVKDLKQLRSGLLRPSDVGCAKDCRRVSG